MSGDDEVAVLSLAAFILHTFTCLAPGLVNVISSFGDDIVTLARVIWNISMSFKRGKAEFRNGETENYGYVSRGTRDPGPGTTKDCASEGQQCLCGLPGSPPLPVP
jgi:hypothetical protein